MKKRLLSLLMIVTILFMLAPVNGFAAGEADVSTFAQFKSALEKADVTKINLLNNITMSATAVTINSSKPSLEINGCGYTITEANSNLLTHTLRMTSLKTLKDITVKDVRIVGKNICGFITIPDLSMYECVKINYENVVYTGPEMIFAYHANVFIKNCDITLAPGAANLSRSVAFAKNVTLEGNVTINKQIPLNPYDIFEICNAGKLTVAPRANVKINNNTVKSSNLLSGFAHFLLCNGALTFGEYSTFEYNGNNCFLNGFPVKSVKAEQYTNVKITVKGNMINCYGLMGIAGSMLIDTGSTFKLIASSNGTCFPAMKFELDSTFTVNSPREVLIYNSSTLESCFGLSIGNLCKLNINYNGIRRLEHWLKVKTPVDPLSTATYLWANSPVSTYNVAMKMTCGTTTSATASGYTNTPAFNAATANLHKANIVRINGGSGSI